MKSYKTLCTAIAVVATFAAGFARAASMTNGDVIKMVDAKLDDTIILTAIENSESKYDASAQGLIELSGAKVPQSIIAAIIKKAAGKDAAPDAPAPQATAAAIDSGSSTAPAVAADVMAPSEVFMIDGGETKSMRYLNPQMRTAARGLGFGGVATYAVLRNSGAATRTKNAKPEFLVSVPNQAQPDSYLTLASFAVRKNNSREVMVGGGYMSYSTGIHPDRIVPVASEKHADQSKAQKGFTIYKVTPSRLLAPGEYAVILYTGEVQGMVVGWFTGSGNSYFDFGVDL